MRQGCRFFICIFVFGILSLCYQKVNWYTWQQKYTMSNQTRTINKSIGASELNTNMNIQNQSLEIQNTNNHTSELSKDEPSYYSVPQGIFA